MILPKYFNKKYFYWTAALLVIAGFVVYSNSFRAPFHFDDQLVIAENYLIKSLNNLDWLLSYDPSRFLTHLTFALNYHFGGLDLSGYHTVNFILHLSVATLVYFLLQYTLSLAKIERFSEKDIHFVLLFAVLLFVVHPLQTQAVTYIAQRSTLLASLCYLGSLLLYIISRLNNSLKFYSAALFVMLLGIFTKPIIVTLPLAMLLYEICFLDFRKTAAKNVKQVLIGLIPFVLMALMVPVWIMAWKFKTVDIERYLDITRETQSYSRWEYLFTQFNVLMTYARLLFFPVNQNLDYDYPIADGFFTFPTWLSFAAIAGILGTAVYLFNRQRLFAFCLFWMAVTLSLESSIFPIADVINEHRLYLPMLGFALLISFGLKTLVKKREFYIGIMAVIIVVFGWLTFQRNVIWGDRIAMLLDITAKSPNKSRVYNNLGNAYNSWDKLEAAEKAYHRSIELRPTFAHPRNNLANVYFKQGRLDEAEAELEKALELEPDYAGAYYNLGNVAWARGDAERARELYSSAIKLNPSFVLAMVAFAKTCRYFKDFKRSEFALYAARDIDPTYDSIYINLGDLYLTLGEYDKAFRQYQIALRYAKEPAMLLNNIGNIYDIFRDYDQAEMMYKEAIWRDPGYAHSYFNLGNTLRKTGDYVQARIFLEKAISLYAQQNNKRMADVARERLSIMNP